MSGATCLTKREVLVGMGQISVGRDDVLLRSVLGSCVGLAIYDEQRRIAAHAHIVLPASSGRVVGSPGKCVDTAIPWMIDALRAEGAIERRLLAKLIGGANMFAGNGPFKIGQNNADEVRRLLREFRIPLVGEDVGGKQGRRVTFNCANCQYTVEVSGQIATTV